MKQQNLAAAEGNLEVTKADIGSIWPVFQSQKPTSNQPAETLKLLKLD
jgi:hypothetical protein